jgi:hypothetical protein
VDRDFVPVDHRLHSRDGRFHISLCVSPDKEMTGSACLVSGHLAYRGYPTNQLCYAAPFDSGRIDALWPLQETCRAINTAGGSKA